MKFFPSEIFKAYDIRGVVETELKPSIVKEIGNVLGTMALEANIEAIVVGYDGRHSSPLLAQSVIAGIIDSGCNVYNIGEVTTPMLYFANYELKTLSGVMITGSHNPPEYNGLKMVINNITLSKETIKQIEKRLNTSDYRTGYNASISNYDIEESYIEKIVSTVTLQRQMNIVVDCGNGVAGKIAPKLYRRMGAKVLGLFCEVDGNFPNHHPDPSNPKNLVDLINAVSTSATELGLAFDGDGDRLGIVTANGNIIYPDRQMMLFAADVLAKNPQAKIVYDIKSTSLLSTWITSHGGEPIICKTGHSFIKAKIKQTNALLAGEMSGHIFFNDKWYGFDDGVYAGARMLEILSHTPNATEILNAIPKLIATPEINIKLLPGQAHAIVESIVSEAKFPKAINVITLDGVRAEYSYGFGLIRASNTMPVIVLRFEAQTEELLNDIKNDFKQILKQYILDTEF